jgi:hypothetical protein
MNGTIDIPEELRVEFRHFAYSAKGVQIYRCGDDGRWMFQAPSAQLYDDDDQLVAEHFSGPTWQAADGSTVVAKKISEASPDPASIPWLLLEAVSNTGEGVFKNVKYIQRLSTVGGKAPSVPCDGPALNEVSYEAIYVFHVLKAISP